MSDDDGANARAQHRLERAERYLTDYVKGHGQDKFKFKVALVLAVLAVEARLEEVAGSLDAIARQ